MKPTMLTYEQRLLLQRLHDQDATLSPAQQAQAQALLAEHELARQFVEALAEVNTATNAAAQEAWDKAPARTFEQLASMAMEATAPELQPLEALMPYLERVHDGEVDEAELALFELLLESRPDVADYMAALDETHHGVLAGQQEVLERADFSNFWASLDAKLDQQAPQAAKPQAQIVSFPKQPQTAERPQFDLKEHQLMLARYFDGQATEQEANQVQAWLEIDPVAAQTLEVFGELSLAVQGAVDELCERTPLEHIWSGVEAALGSELDAAPGKVVSLAHARQAREQQAEQAADQAAASDKNSVWAKLPRRELFAAVAAALLTVAGLGAFGDKIFKASPVVVERTVVIVDSVEYSSGSSGMVVQPASLELEPKPAAQPSIESNAQESGEPTIIWLLDDDEAKAQPSPKEAPADKAPQPQAAPDQGQPI